MKVIMIAVLFILVSVVACDTNPVIPDIDGTLVEHYIMNSYPDNKLTNQYNCSDKLKLLMLYNNGSYKELNLICTGSGYAQYRYAEFIELYHLQNYMPVGFKIYKIE